ncbi:MAG: type II toxin-antitoxin system HicA family toxin [Candidatus Saccharimonadales bacterium]
MAGFKSLPSLNPNQVVKVLKRCGYVELRQKGSHLILYNQQTKSRVTIPMHKGKDIKKPLLKKIIEQEAAMTIDEFLDLL